MCARRRRQVRLEMAQVLIGSPLFAHLDSGTLKLAVVLFELASNRVNSVNASAVEPANPAIILSL